MPDQRGSIVPTPMRIVWPRASCGSTFECSARRASVRLRRISPYPGASTAGRLETALGEEKVSFIL